MGVLWLYISGAVICGLGISYIQAHLRANKAMTSGPRSGWRDGKEIKMTSDTKDKSIGKLS